MLLFRKSSLWGCFYLRHFTNGDVFLFINSKIWILDFEIWKASNMLFQELPYEKEEDDNHGQNDDLWDDTWHKKFETRESHSVQNLKSDTLHVGSITFFRVE